VLDFVDPAGACTGRLLPTGNAIDRIDGIPISCVDFAIPVVLVPARALGKTGYESKAELDADAELLATLQRLRRKAALVMGLPDPGHSVLPKVALLASPRQGGTITSRFYVPWNCHVAHSTTGALCIAAATLVDGTVAAGLAAPVRREAPAIVIEHPSGCLAVRVELARGTHAAHASVVLTARPLFDGAAFVRRAAHPVPQ
jgi:4-oxalomesaconate tautomerase